MRKASTPTVFDPAEFLASAGLGRKLVHLKATETFFTQGSSCTSIYYLKKGRAKLTIISAAGKEATIGMLAIGEFIGEECIAGVAGPHLTTATAITACAALKIEQKEMSRALHEEQSFS